MCCGRVEALKVVLDFTSKQGLVHAAQLLYQLEAMLLQSSMPNKKVSVLATPSILQIA